MPYVNVQITRGASRQQKAEIVRDITDSLVRVLGKKPEHTHVVIQEIDDENWGFSGMLTDDWKAAQAGTASPPISLTGSRQNWRRPFRAAAMPGGPCCWKAG